MQLLNTTQKYGSIAQLLHWVMAVLILTMLALGLYMVSLPLGTVKLKLYGWHKQLGVLVFMLVILRLLWRFGNLQPVYPNHMPTWQKLAANCVHIGLYGLMFALPLSGWILTSAAGLPISFFGFFVLPDLVAPNEILRTKMVQIHDWLGYGLILFLCAHIGAALVHHFIEKDDILRRMLPWKE